MQLCFKCGIGIGNLLKSPIEDICKYCYVPEPIEVIKPKPKKIKPKKKPKNCIVCNAEYIPKSNRQKICLSDDCKKKMRKEYDRRWHSKNYVPKESELTKECTCTECGSKFIGKPNTKLCSYECRDARRRASQIKYRSKLYKKDCFRWTNQHNKMLLKYLQQGLTNVDIANKFGCSSQTIGERKKKLRSIK